MRLIPGSEFPQSRNGNPLQYSCLENSMDRGAWRPTYSLWGCKESDTTECMRTHTHHKLFTGSMDYRQFWWGRGEWKGGLQLLNLTHFLKVYILRFPNEYLANPMCVCVCVCVCMCVCVCVCVCTHTYIHVACSIAQSCWTLCNPTDFSP